MATDTGTMQLAESNTSADGTYRVYYRDSNHSYSIAKWQEPVWRGSEPGFSKPEWVPGCTGILGAYDKPALVGAAAKVTLEGVSTLANTKGVTVATFRDVDKLAWRLKAQGLRHWQVWGKAADRGTFVHAVSQAWIEDGRVPTADEVPEDYREYVRAFGNFCVAHEPESLASEVIVGSLKYRYAGRYDWKVRLTKECDVDACGCHLIASEGEEYGTRGIAGKTVRCDFKTSRGLYPENMAQLDLYEVAAVEMGEDQADYRAPLRLGKDGSYEFIVSRLKVGDALGLVQGYYARQNVERLHEFLNPRKGGKRG